jgi:hypothetical protein
MQNNAAIIIDYIAAMWVEINPSDNYRKDLIEFICRFPSLITINLSRI